MTVKMDKVVEYNSYIRDLENKGSMEAEVNRFCMAWAKKMELKMLDGAELEDIALEAEKECYKEDPSLDITGSMYAYAVAFLVEYWQYGEELRKWHNKKYHYDGEGTVNSSVITIGR